MKKQILVIGMALALGGMSTSALAADNGNFYIGAGIGQAQWDLDNAWVGVNVDDSDTSANVRFGYVWHWDVDFAVEGGYIDLGKVKADLDVPGDIYHSRIENQGLFGGVKLKYGFARHWYVDGRLGLYQGQLEGSWSSGVNTVSASGSFDETDSGWYAGVGFGYDVTRHFSLGLNYDRFHNQLQDVDINVDTITVSGEYRF